MRQTDTLNTKAAEMKPALPAQIRFRAKVRKMLESDGSESPYIEYKRKVKRADCNLRPSDHDYYNSDMFPSMLQRAYESVIGSREWARLSALPVGVSVDPSSFLAEVTVNILV